MSAQFRNCHGITEAQEQLFFFIQDNPGIRARYLPGDTFENGCNLARLAHAGLIFSVPCGDNKRNRYYRWYATERRN